MTNKYTSVSNDILYVGVDDTDIDLFEGQYVVPEGISYNSYLILDDKICVMDSVDARKSDAWMANLTSALNGRQPDYLVVSHCEPDHASSVAMFLDRYRECKVVCSSKALSFLGQFFPGLDIASRSIVVKDGETLTTGRHTLTFIAAPMVHWPEVMMTFDATDGVLFSADGFGKFGALCNETDDWACEARRYYFNIVGKYGQMVQNVLKKAAALDIKVICPLHGPVLRENLGYYIGLYDTWSAYRAETEGVFVAYCSLHGNTAVAALELVEMLKERGLRVAASDLARADMAECVEDAFRYSHMVLCAPTYDGAVMPVMSDFLHHLQSKNFQNRTVALVENGTWAPMAAKTMRGLLETMKNINIVEPIVTIRSVANDGNHAQLKELAAAIS